MTDDSAAGRYGSGHEVRRIEDEALLKGAGRFADDVSLPGQLWLCFQRSPHAHATIRGVDSRRAAAMPGVVAILTGEDFRRAGVKPIPAPAMFNRPDGSPMATPARPALAQGIVRFVGEAVVAVVAETRDQAKDAIEEIDVDYEDLPVVVDMSDARSAGAPLVWPAASGNIAAEARYGDPAAVEAAFRTAAHVVALDLVSQRLAPSPMEPRSVLASLDPATERLTLRVSSQMPSSLRDILCNDVLGIPTERVRVLVGDVGGGFGMKTGLYPEDIAVAFAALTLKRPVKWTAERIEEFLAASHGRDLESRAELALDANGKVLAYRIRSFANVGAYAGRAGTSIQLMIGPWVLTSVYDIAPIDVSVAAVLTNTAPTAPYRGAGRPEAIYMIERLLDTAAARLKLDPAEIRRRNFVRPEQMPYRNAMGQVYDSGNFGSIVEQALTLAKWDEFPRREADSRARRRLRGRGLASFLEWTGASVFEERATVQVSAEGEIEVYATTMPMGQGIATSYAQLVVDVFGVPIDRIRIVQGDSDRGSGFGSVASRSLFTAGSAIRRASEKAVATARMLAADALEAAPADIDYAEGEFRITGTDRRIGLFELAGRQPERRIFVDLTSKVDGPSWPNGCHVCEVEIDPETGVPTVVSYVSVNDAGRMVNPMIVRGQLDGGVAQGLGQALGERMMYDRDSGQTMTGSFMDYAMPRADDLCNLTHVLDQSTPCLTNPLGAKGVGELGTIGAMPAVVNAVVDALSRAGRAEAAVKLQMPLTAEKLWRALRGD